MSNIKEDKVMTKIAIVTGASRGLRKSTVLNLAKKGVDAILTYHSNAAEVAKVVAEIESLGAKA
jgi:NAD(P)-dependent dehydrogenase (short-subunit alcohol dehydrogenase family)